MYSIGVNFFAVVIGGLLGCLWRGGVPERFRVTMTQGMALCVLVIGIMGAIKSGNALLLIISLVVGSVAGEGARIEQRLGQIGDFAQRKIRGADNRFSEAFVTASLLFSVGAMAVVGSLEAGLSGKPDTILAKSALDGISSILLASTLGPGVILAALPLTIYQGGIALLSGVVEPYLSAQVINEMSAVGSLLIIGIGLNMLNIEKLHVKVSNMLPAMFVPIVYFPLVEWVTRYIR